MKLRDAGVAVTTEIADLDREERRADADVEQVRQRKDRDLRRLDTGQVSSPKELENLQSEIASLERRQSVLEEAELEVMERLEEARKRSSHLETEREDVGRRAQEVQRARDAAWEEIDNDTESARQQRAAVVADIPADLLSLYDKIRADGAASAQPRSANAGARGAASPSTLPTSPGSGPPLPTPSSAARSAGGSWSARPSRGCEPAALVVEADGGSRGNPGPAAFGAWSATPTPARCSPSAPRRSASRPTTSRSTAV